MNKFTNLVKGCTVNNNLNELKSKLSKGEIVNSLWGAAPTGPAHIAYLIPILKQLEFLKFGFQHKVILADMHSVLDPKQYSWSVKDRRTQQYRICFEQLGLDSNKTNVEYHYSSQFIFDKEYIEQLLRLSVFSKLSKIEDMNNKIFGKTDLFSSSIFWMLMRILDIHYFNVDVALGGKDEEPNYLIGSEFLKKAGFNDATYFSNPMLIGINGEEAHSSNSDSTIFFQDTNDIIKSKVNNSFFNPNNPTQSFVYSYVNYIFFPRNRCIRIDCNYDNISDFNVEFINGKIDLNKIKKIIIEDIVNINERIRPDLIKEDVLL